MPSFEVLDAVADAYVPALGFLWLLLVLISLPIAGWRAATMRFAFGASNLVVAYGLMWLDNRFAVWPALGLDYSTHAAVALALVVVAGTTAPPLVLPLGISLALYASLMVYQGYHTIADLLSTMLVVVLPISAIAYRWAATRRPARD